MILNPRNPRNPLIDILAPHIGRVSKMWGAEYWLVNNDKYCMKLLEINPGYQCSLHYHKIKDETFLLVSGEARLTVNDFIHHMVPSNQIRINPNDIHRFGSLRGALIIEISTHHDDADTYRLEESRKIETLTEKSNKS